MEERKNNTNNKSNKLRKYLPIGTVILLKDAKKRLMITGFCATSNKDGENKRYDYCGVVYPEGVLSVNKTFLFDHNQIAKVYHLGLYKDEEEKIFKKKLREIIREKEQKK